MSAASYLSMRGAFLAGARLLLCAWRQEPPAARRGCRPTVGIYPVGTDRWSVRGLTR